MSSAHPRHPDRRWYSDCRSTCWCCSKIRSPQAGGGVFLYLAARFMAVLVLTSHVRMSAGPLLGNEKPRMMFMQIRIVPPSNAETWYGRWLGSCCLRGRISRRSGLNLTDLIERNWERVNAWISIELWLTSMKINREHRFVDWSKIGIPSSKPLSATLTYERYSKRTDKTPRNWNK